MSSIVFERTIQRIQVEQRPATYRIIVGGQGPAGANGNLGKMIGLTQVEYDALSPPDPNSIYYIVPEE